MKSDLFLSFCAKEIKFVVEDVNTAYSNSLVLEQLVVSFNSMF